MKKLLLAIVLIVGCEEDALNITETEITHSHDDGHFTCIWGTNALFYEDGSPVINPNWALGAVVIGTPVDTLYYHAPDSSNAISQCIVDANYDEAGHSHLVDDGDDSPPGDPIPIEFEDLILGDDDGNGISIQGYPSKYCTCEAGVLY